MKEGEGGPTVDIVVHGHRHRVSPLHVRVLRLLQLFESRPAMAEHFAVPRSELDAWLRGAVPPGAARVLDLSYVWERATQDQPDEAVRVWLRSQNRFVGGVSARRGPAGPGR